MTAPPTKAGAAGTKRSRAAVTPAAAGRPSVGVGSRAPRRAPAAAPADHGDPRFTAVLAAFAADPARAAVAEEFAANQMAGGRRRFGSRALKVDGKIFAMISHGRFVVKLPGLRVAALVAAGDGEYFDPGHGRKMKQWLSITSARPSWTELALEAHAFVGGA